MSWQPIETAPRDGTKFIGFGKPAYRMPDGAYQTYWSSFGEGSIARLDFKAGNGPEGGFWYEETNRINTWRPTHWMPLPPPPEGDKP